MLRSKLVRNSGWMLAGYAARLGFQAATFLLLARLLGPASYGSFTAYVAIAMTISPFLDLGTYSIVVRDVARGRAAREAMGDSLLVTMLGIAPALVLFVGVAALTLGREGLLPACVVALGIFIGSKLFNLARSAFVAHERMWKSAVIEILGSSLQLGAVVVARDIRGGLVAWCIMYAAIQGVVGVAAMGWGIAEFGAPRWQWGNLRSRVRDGLHFSTAGAANMVSSSMDKIMLPALGTLDAAGVYAAASRVTAVALTPMMAVLGALYPRMFKAGAVAGMKGSRSIAWRFTPWFALYGLCAMLGLWITAPWLSLLLGRGYVGVDMAVRLLGLVLVIQAPLFLYGDALSGGGEQPARTYGQVGSLVVNAMLLFVLVPGHGWMGAVVANLATQAALLAFVLYRCRPRAVATA